MVIGLIASGKLISVVAKDMVQTEVAKSLAQNLLSAGRRILASSLQNVDSLSSASSKKLSPARKSAGQPESTEYLVYNWLEDLFAWFQMIILWHNPSQSVFTLTGLFSSFLLLTYIAPRFYATILIAVFVYNFTKVWFKHVWPEIRVTPSPEAEQESRMDVDRFSHLDPQLLTLSELSQLVCNLMEMCKLYASKLLELRREKPGSFCILVCSILSSTAFIGNRISGLNLILCTITGFISAPGIYLYLLPPEVKQYLSQTVVFELLQRAIQESRESQLEAPSLAASKSPHEEESRAESTPESSSSTAAAGTTTHRTSSSSLSPLNPYTLFDNLMSMAYQSSSNSNPASSNQGSDQRSTDTIVPKGVLERITKTVNRGEKGEDEEPLLGGASNEQDRNSAELSSNESTSLIDFDEDQQDDFVIL